MTDDKMREAFEARDDVAFDYERDERGEYVYGGERQSFRDFCAGWQAAAAQQAQEIEALRAQVQDQALHLISAHAQAEDAHADAQRYRWLRNEANNTMGDAPMVFMSSVGVDITWNDAIYEESLDANVDAAMHKAKK